MYCNLYCNLLHIQDTYINFIKFVWGGGSRYILTMLTFPNNQYTSICCEIYFYEIFT